MKPEATAHETDAPAARRLRSADVIAMQERIIEAITTRKTTGDVSVDFTRNAKGDTQIAVKVSAPIGVDPLELAAHADEVYGVAKTTYEAAAAAYPVAS